MARIWVIMTIHSDQSRTRATWGEEMVGHRRPPCCFSGFYSRPQRRRQSSVPCDPPFPLGCRYRSRASTRPLGCMPEGLGQSYSLLTGFVSLKVIHSVWMLAFWTIKIRHWACWSLRSLQMLKIYSCDSTLLLKLKPCILF